MPVFDVEDEPGFWMVTVLLVVVLAYNVCEFVALQRRSNQPELAADSVDGASRRPWRSA